MALMNLTSNLAYQGPVPRSNVGGRHADTTTTGLKVSFGTSQFGPSLSLSANVAGVGLTTAFGGGLMNAQTGLGFIDTKAPGARPNPNGNSTRFGFDDKGNLFANLNPFGGKADLNISKTSGQRFQVDSIGFSDRGVAGFSNQQGSGVRFPIGPAGEVFAHELGGQPNIGFSLGRTSRYTDSVSTLGMQGLGATYSTQEGQYDQFGSITNKTSPLDVSYNHFNTYDTPGFNPFATPPVSILHGIQRPGNSMTSTFALGDNSSGITTGMQGFTTTLAAENHRAERTAKFNLTPAGQQFDIKTKMLSLTGRFSGIGSKKQQQSDLAGGNTAAYGDTQNVMQYNSIGSGVNSQNNNLVQINNATNPGGGLGSQQSAYGVPTVQPNQGNPINAQIIDDGGLASNDFNHFDNSSGINPAATSATGLDQLSSDLGQTVAPTNTSLESQWQAGTMQNAHGTQGPSNDSSNPYGGTSDSTGDKAFSGQEIINSTVDKEGIGKDELKPPNWQKTDKRDKVVEGRESGEGTSDIEQYTRMAYGEIPDRKPSNNPPAPYDFLKKGNYSLPDNSGKLANKSYDDGEMARDPEGAQLRGGSFNGGGKSSDIEVGGKKASFNDYNSLGSPKSRSGNSKSDGINQEPQFGGGYGDYASDGAFGSIGSSYSKGGGVSKTRWDVDKDDKMNPGDLKFKFKTDDVGEIEMKAYLTTLGEAFAPSWEGAADQGRADARYLYTSFERTINIGFIIDIPNKDKFKDTWEKTKKLALMTHPVYKSEGFHGQICKVTVGKLFEEVNCIITDLTYDWDTETPWELDSSFHAPMRTTVDMSFTILGDDKEGKRFQQDNKVYSFL